MTEIFMPKAGMDMKEGVLVRWLKEIGDPVEKDEPIMEIETDKITMEAEASAGGYLLATYCQGGDLVPVLGVMDVSFISVKLILPKAAELMEHKGRFYILIKPQFEAGRENVGKKGVVRDPAVHVQVIENIRAFLPEIHYHMAQLDFSPITGPEGNIEYITELLPGEEGGVDEARVREVVEQAHATLYV